MASLQLQGRFQWPFQKIVKDRKELTLTGPDIMPSTSIVEVLHVAVEIADDL